MIWKIYFTYMPKLLLHFSRLLFLDSFLTYYSLSLFLFNI